ncbi:homoserine kinase [Bombella sp. TMW 2.2543]|uniref:Homoserine kinase n=1 Tax=Bombella pluederhausensis TaxID=2967336 RepID=A0ABT3WFP0_9PROT|nr:homoserine kinase [Bombella pluederhausensis]MCX5617922.1 homoserine kinase [Bombella pluederhausensis]
MAVYTDVKEEVLRDFLALYSVGELRSFTGIAEGIENSNFLVETSQDRFILTLFEKRMNPEDLPWFLGLMNHLAEQGIACPQPIAARDGIVLHQLAGRPAVMVSFLKGHSLDEIMPSACEQVGRALARLHEAGRSYRAERPNALAPQGWVELFARCTDGGDEKIAALIAETESALDHIVTSWPEAGQLPCGQIHADLFVDNVFFRDGSLSGVIDFYFACTDFLAYDLAICLNAWCFEEDRHYRQDRAEALLRGYEQVRPLSKAEREALPVLCQGAAMRFLLTRLYDWVHTPAGALVTRKDPWAYQRRLIHFQKVSHV